MNAVMFARAIPSVGPEPAELAKTGKRVAVLIQREGNMIFIPLKFQDE